VSLARGNWLLATLGLAFASGGCAGGLKLAELPADPIAVRYFDPEQARLAQEDLGALELASRRGASQRASRTRLGVASVKDFNQFLSSSFQVKKGSSKPGNRQDANERSPRLALLDPKTRELTLLPHARSGSVPVDWSENRRFLLFTQISRGYDQLFEYDRERAEWRPITREPGAHPWGCYASDGRIVAEEVIFQSRQPTSHLVISNPGGGQFRQLTTGPSDQCLAWPTAGNEIAYISGGRGVEGSVMVTSLLPAKAGGEAEIGPPRKISQGIDPSFSPDGKFIFFSATTRVQEAFGRRDRWRLRRARVSGLGRGSFEMGPVDQFEPAISPDGKIVAYVGIDPQFNQVLYVRRVDGTGERILFNDGAALGPVW